MALNVCTKCVMDTTDPDIWFDDQGVCNHCQSYYKAGAIYFAGPGEKKAALERLVHEIREKGKSEVYDCVIGVSGGVDSTYVAYKVKELGLKPLAVHLDNGWNSELAISNIEKAMSMLKIDLITYIIDWEEFKDLQLSFFKASCVDIEMLTDHALLATLFNMANQHGLFYIVFGTNYATEAIMPASWNHLKLDLKNIKTIHKKFGQTEMKSYPTISINRWAYSTFVTGIKTIALLDYIDYEKEEVIMLLEEKLDWRRYQNKHDESIFTKFYQDYILPSKFNIDKRKAHFSAMINSGQMSREDALSALKQKPEETSDSMHLMKEYFLKKMSLSECDFEAIMALPIRRHCDYPSDEPYFRLMAKAYKSVTKYVKGK